LDLRLPRIDGLEVLKQIKRDLTLQAIPVVVLTTSDAEKDLAQAYEYHANSYVTKPVNFDNFSHLLRDLGYYWLAWNKRPW
jgi:CheY-like chemotaxis protein